MIVQFCLFVILLYVLFSNTTGFLSPLVFAVSSIVATIIMGVISFKFFSWYKLSNNKNLTILFYGVAAATLAMSIAQEAGSKLLMIQVIQEESPLGAITRSSFLYKASQKYHGEIEYKVVNPHTTTTLYILPNSNLQLYVGLASTVLPIAFVFRWLASTTLLRSFYQRIRKLPLSLWIILSLPLVLYLVGKMPGFFSGESLLGVDEAYRFYFRLLFRIGTVGGNILFGLAFFVVARSVKSLKLRDYLIIAGIGDTIVGIALSTSALQQTYGIAAHSLVLLSSYMFSMGLYLSAIAVSQDSSLRQAIRRSAIELIHDIGTAEMEQEIRKRVTMFIQNQQREMEEQTGGFSDAVTENDMKDYMEIVIEEKKRSATILAGREKEKSTSSTITMAAATKAKKEEEEEDNKARRLQQGSSVSEKEQDNAAASVEAEDHSKENL